jgi:DNA-binding CsgD family transcriptional regulator
MKTVATLASVVSSRPEYRFPSAAATVGFLVTDEHLSPLYLNQHCVKILLYPNGGRDPSVWTRDIQQRLRHILGAEDGSVRTSSGVPFTSGRRRCVCRTFQLHSQLESDGAPALAVLLERQQSDWSTALADASGRFNLSRRETETVQHLVHGMTTKEIASRMGVSPNTVKQFVRLIMSKMGVSTRAGVIGKILRR